METYHCKFCSSENIKITEVTFKNKTKHLERRCMDCHRQNGYAPKNIPAEDWKLPFGKYKGETLGTVGKKDRDYLLWLYETTEKETLRNRIDETLSFLD